VRNFLLGVISLGNWPQLVAGHFHPLIITLVPAVKVNQNGHIAIIYLNYLCRVPNSHKTSLETVNLLQQKLETNSLADNSNARLVRVDMYMQYSLKQLFVCKRHIVISAKVNVVNIRED